MEINYDDLFEDENNIDNIDKSNNNVFNKNIFHFNPIKAENNQNNNKLLGKKHSREISDENAIKNNNKNNKNKKNKNKKSKKEKLQQNSEEQPIEQIEEKLHKNLTKNIAYQENNILDSYYSLNDKINISTNSIYDFANSLHKTKYQDILGKKKSIIKIQDYIYSSEFYKKIINYKVITQMKTINFHTNNNIFQKGRQSDTNGDAANEGLKLIELGLMPSLGFWQQRFYYFSKYDEGIKLDYESWYSVTPEELSIYIAKFCADKVVLDGFGGCGGNTIQFSKHCKKVYYNEIDANKLNYCQNNCKIYECQNNIEFINSDFLKLKNQLKADIVFLSPPWGGMDYNSTEKYSLKKWVYPDIAEILETSLSISDNLILYLPRNIEIEELFIIFFQTIEKLKSTTGKNFDELIFCDIHILYSANKTKALLIFIGELFNHVSSRNLKDYLSSFYKKVSEKDIYDVIEIIKLIGLEEYLEFTNLFYEKLKKNIKKLKHEFNPSYDRNEFITLLKFIIKQSLKKDKNFLDKLQAQIFNKNKTEKENRHSLLKGILKFYLNPLPSLYTEDEMIIEEEQLKPDNKNFLEKKYIEFMKNKII